MIRRLKKLSASQKKLKTENLAKNGMPNLLAYIYGRIVVIPFTGISGDVQIALHSSRPSGSNGEKNNAKQISLLGHHYFTIIL